VISEGFGLVEVSIDNSVCDASLIFKRDKDEAVSGPWPLPGDHLSGDGGFYAMPHKLKITRTKDLKVTKTSTAVRHGMMSYGHSGFGVIGNHTLLGVHGLKWGHLLLVAVQFG